MQKLERIHNELERIAADASGLVGVSFCHVGSDQRLTLNAGELFPMASTYKVAIAARVLKLIDEQHFRLDEMIHLQLVKDGAIGELKHILCYLDGGKPAPWWRSDNEGPLLHDFTHYFDMMDMFAGEVEWVCGIAEQRMRPWAVEDFGAAFMKFNSGVTGMMHSAELTS